MAFRRRVAVCAEPSPGRFAPDIPTRQRRLRIPRIAGKHLRRLPRVCGLRRRNMRCDMVRPHRRPCLRLGQYRLPRGSPFRQGACWQNRLSAFRIIRKRIRGVIRQRDAPARLGRVRRRGVFAALRADALMLAPAAHLDVFLARHRIAQDEPLALQRRDGRAHLLCADIPPRDEQARAQHIDPPVHPAEVVAIDDEPRQHRFLKRRQAVDRLARTPAFPYQSIRHSSSSPSPGCTQRMQALHSRLPNRQLIAMARPPLVPSFYQSARAMTIIFP